MQNANHGRGHEQMAEAFTRKTKLLYPKRRRGCWYRDYNWSQIWNLLLLE